MNCVINAVSIAEKNGNADLYIKNSIVSLGSCTGNVEKILITNIKNLKKEYLEQLNYFNIKIIYCDFNMFNFDVSIPWGLAYYKLCALYYAVHNLKYDSYLLIDTDTIFIRELDDDFWEECQEVSLYYLPYSKNYNDRKIFLKECKQLMGINGDLNYYGGEFVCGNKESIIKYMNECHLIWEKMKQKKVFSTRGDEFIWSIAANNIDRVVFANPFIDRIAISQHYYSSTTNYAYDDCRVLHLICEKETGLIWMYNYMLKHGNIPKLNTIRRVFGLKKAKRDYSSLTMLHIISYIKKICNCSESLMGSMWSL